MNEEIINDPKFSFKDFFMELRIDKTQLYYILLNILNNFTKKKDRVGVFCIWDRASP